MSINLRKGLSFWIISFLLAAALTGWSGYTATQLRIKQQNIEVLEQKINELNIQIGMNAREELRSQALRKEIADLTAQKEILDEDVSESQALIEQKDQYRASVDAAKKVAEDAQKRAREFEMLAETAETNALNAQQAAFEAEKNKDVAEQRLRVVTATLQDLEGKILQAESQILDSQSKAAAETRKAQAAIEDEKRVIERVAQLKKEEIDLQAQLREVGQAIIGQRQTYQQLQADVSGAQDAKNQADSARSDAEASLQIVMVSLEKAKTVLTETEKQIEMKRTEVADLQSKAATETGKAQAAIEDEKRVIERVAQLKKEEIDLQAQLREVGQAIIGQRQTYQQLQADVSGAQDAKNQADSARSDAEASLQIVMESLEKAGATLTETEVQIEMNRTEVANLEQEMADWQQRLVSAKSEESTVVERVRRLDAELDQLDSDRERLRNQLSRLQRQLEDARADTDAALTGTDEAEGVAAQANGELGAPPVQASEAEGDEQ